MAGSFCFFVGRGKSRITVHHPQHERLLHTVAACPWLGHRLRGKTHLYVVFKETSQSPAKLRCIMHAIRETGPMGLVAPLSCCIAESSAIFSRQIWAHLTLGREQSGGLLPDGARSALQRESKNCVGSPPGILLFQQNILDGTVDVDGGHPLAQPLALHVCRRIGPYLQQRGFCVPFCQ